MSEMDDVIESALTGAEVIDFSKVRPRKVEWLWPGRLPVGKLVVFDGDPSTAKSTLSLDLAARVSTGRSWPDGSPCPQGGVILLSAEDGADDTISPRLEAAGADTTNVKLLHRVSVDNGDGTYRRSLPSLPRDVGVLRELTWATGAKLIIVDVLMAYLSGKVDAHRDQDVRGVLSQLADLADETGATILLLRHLNKTAGGSPIYRGGGSIGIVGAARSAFLVARDPEDENRIVLANTKSNLAATPPPMAFRLENVIEMGCARIHWDTDPVSYTADQLLSRPTDENDRMEYDETAEWLRAFLEDQGGSALAKDVFKAGRADGWSDRTLKRIRHRLGVISKRKGFQGGSVWSLPETLPDVNDHDRDDGDDEDDQDAESPIRATETSIRANQASTQGPGPNGPNGPNGVDHEQDRDQTVTGDHAFNPLALHYLDQSMGAIDRQRQQRPACRICREPLPDSALAEGHDTHATCQEG